MREGEGHRERDGNGYGPQDGGPAFPESDERYDDNERDGFVERVHEEVGVFFYLARLVGGVSDDEIGGEEAFCFGELLFDVLGETRDLLAAPHLHRKTDGSRAPPISLRVAARVAI